MDDNIPITQPDESNAKGKRGAYKVICAKLGLIMCVYFLCRIIGGLVGGVLNDTIDSLSDSILYLLLVINSVIFSYIIPISIAMIVFKSTKYYGGRLNTLYKKPKRLARALGSFPAMYGMGFGVVLLTLLLIRLISSASSNQSVIDELFRPTTLQPSTNIPSVLILLFMLVIVAPIFEEFLVRGIIYDAIKPYGCGMAIIISSVLFGLMHGSLYMLFYTTALGFALAYIRYATGSLFVTTILHAIINSVAGGILLLSSLVEFTNNKNKLINTGFSLYILALFILIIVGVIAFIRRIPTIRRYKIENAWCDIGAGKKTALFFLSVPVIIMLVLAFNEHTNNLLINLIIPLK